MARQLGQATIGLGSESGAPPIGGVDPTVLSLPALASDEALILRPLAAGDAPIENWALGLDLYVPQPTTAFVSLLQTGDGDGDLFLRDNGDGTAGVGVSGVYDGTLAFDQWNRLIVTFTTEGGATVLRKYLNGAQIGGTQNLGTTDRWDISAVEGLKLLADDSGETAPVTLSAVFFSSIVPPPADVAGLVASIALPNAAGFFPGAPVSGAIELDFANEDVAPRYGAAEVILEGFDFRTPVQLNDSVIAFSTQFGIAGPGGEDVPVLAYADYAPDEGVLIRLPGIVGDLSSYTAVWDINVNPLAGFQALLQTDTSQSGDAEFFIRGDGGLGIAGNYDGAVTPGAWSRIAITVADLGNGSATLSKYLNGALLDSQTVDAARFTLDSASGFLLMTDDDGETGEGFLAHFGLSSEVLDAAAIAALGGADGDGPFEAETDDAAPLPPTGTGTRLLTLSFDSSFRPYDGQTGEVLVSVDGNDFASLLTLTTANSGGDSSLSRVNETISLAFTVAEDAQNVAFRFNLRDAGNDWWWAVDNITLADQGGALLYAENFDGLAGALQDAVDENITFPGWTDTPPAGWTRENSPDMPQGTTEWQGWSFATPAFWTAADGQNRADFTKGQGVVAIADPDEWDDFNEGSQNGADFDSTIATPTIALEIPGAPITFQIGFDGYTPTVEFGFASVEVIDAEPVQLRQNNIADLLLRDDGTAVEIDLAAAFGAEASGFVATSADGTAVEAVVDGAILRLTGSALGHSDVTVTAIVDGETITEFFRAIVAGPNAYIFAVIPDTQDYTSDQTLADNSFFRMTEWLLDQQQSLNVAHAIHVGDIVQFGAASQWEIAEDAMERLDGQLTYTLAVGNHDQQRPGFSSAFSFESDVDEYFAPEQVGATAAQGGGTYDGLDVGPDTFGNGSTYADSIRNHYSTITTPDGGKWLIFSLEFGMPDDVLRWAGEVIEQHLDHRVIIDTHSWNGGDGRINPTTQDLTTDNGGWGYGIRDNPRNVNDGEDTWREFASKYPNVTFTFNGHNFVGGAETVVSYGAGDNPVHQIFVNYQNGAWRGPEGVGSNGGNGAMRLIVIDPDNDRFTTHTKLVELDTYFDEFPDHQEVFEGIDFGAPEQIAIAKAGATEIVAGDGVTAMVQLDASETLGDTTGARFAWFAADGEKLGETGGPTLDVALATGTNRLVLQVTDRNGNVSTHEKVVIVEAPGALLTETFDDGDAAGWGAPGGASSYVVKGSIFGNPDGEGEAALYQQSNGANEIILWQEGADWSDYVFDTVIEPADNDTVGAVFYWQDPQNHYRLTMNQQNDLRSLVKVEDGVETVLATETASYRHFAMQDLRIAVLDGRITITLDNELLFGGPVTDASPLAGGTVGFLTQSMNRVLFDNVSVNPITLAARALAAEPEGRWAADLDSNGVALFDLTAKASLSAAGIASYEWLVGGQVKATGQDVTLALAPGETTVTLRTTDTNGLVAEDRITLKAASQLAILVNDDFSDGDFAGWTVVDEGTIGGPSDWSVEGGALVQASDIASTQQGTGSNAYSVAGDGPFILRDGTYALWDNAAATSWTDYAVEATLTPNDDDGIGLLFRYTDAENYYKLEADAQTGLVMLTRHLDGRETILARGWGEYTPGEAQHWRIEVEGGAIRAFIDGKAVFGTPIEDRTLETGTIGLYAWGSEDLAFDDVLVTLLDNPLNPVLGTSASEFLRGTDMANLIVAGGGAVDRITAGAGLDQFDFTAIRADSGRNTIRVSDMEAGETIIGIDPATDIVTAVARGTSLHITLAGDGDLLILTGVTSVDQLNWVPADSLI